ncbi:MAG: phosphate ABC transporter, permease protein PstA [Candidatus Fischerbacteria bacterium RBG_13_37_8]|uniref:Phosphate transport system permease protein PstA n=1 Tax=Candidatus Fischerbacteria bacterium RBG_13_37_8 TaxID=1817863 RepID=A0A1F5VXB2_9BACT|nr:MAG: phosphate ABC transporter, permease protein PstA [Candidatus Fischerbacteria bacterium RBG_13_37_8]
MRFQKTPHISFRIFKDHFFMIAIIILSVIASFPLLFILFHIFSHGFSSINWEFLMRLPKPVGEAGGGIINAIVGTVLLIIFSCIVALPPGIIAGIYLSENKEGRLSYFLSLSVEVLQSIPSIVIGIIVYVWVVRPFKHFSLLAGSVALGIMMLPVIVKTTEETLKLIPNYLKEASLALGVPYYRTILRVVVPAGLSGIITGILIAIARIAGETAPLLFTAFGNPFMNANPLKPVDSLPLAIFNYAKSPFPEWHALAWGASLVLIIMVLGLNLITRLVTKKWKVRF